MLQGETVSLGSGSLRAHVDGRLEPLTDVKLRFDFCVQAHCFSDIYAKVQEVEAKDGHPVYRLRFTAIQKPDRRILERWLEET